MCIHPSGQVSWPGWLDLAGLDTGCGAYQDLQGGTLKAPKFLMNGFLLMTAFPYNTKMGKLLVFPKRAIRLLFCAVLPCVFFGA